MKHWMTEKLGRQLMAIFYSVFALSVITSVASYLYVDNAAGRTKEQVLDQLQKTQWFWSLNLLIFLFCLLFIVRPLIHRVTSQLQELNVKSRRLAEGKSISLEHDVDSHNEVGQLTASFYSDGTFDFIPTCGTFSEESRDGTQSRGTTTKTK
ncbi:hypothetical protein OVA29_14540 [Exiguobacterium sp. SL14]|nr:hypothetical protein [Exiguobacterium sp. SL14]MCY1691741.1 hypothetical protein [Exiguobacterium sp. SL14]